MASKISYPKFVAIFEIMDPKNLCFDIHNNKMLEKNFDLLLEVKGHSVASESKANFDILNPKKINVLIFFMTKHWKRIFDHLLEVRGHLVASESSYPKILCHF